MSDCKVNSSRIDLLVDGELTSAEELELRAHMSECGSCQRELEATEALSRSLRAERLQPAPAALRARVQAILEQQPTDERPSARAGAVEQGSGSGLRLVPAARRLVFAQVGMRVAAGLAVAFGLVFAAHYEHDRARASDFVGAAITGHREIASGTTPLEVSSGSPEVVTAWFSKRVSFQFRMPNSGLASEDRAKYVLEGGRLTSFHGQRAALLAFRMASETVSILVAPEAQARAMGGVKSYSDAIEFHSIDVSQSHVVTWDFKGLIYALVSDQPMTKRSCGACHRDSGQVTPEQARMSGSMMEVVQRPPL